MSTVPINHLDLVDSPAAAAIQGFVQQYHTLEKLILAPYPIVSMTAQDEFTSDLVIRYAESIYLVYDVTWLGAVTAVAVWTSLPDAEALLQARLRQGWQPKTTGTREGERILGYAACLIK